jgi:hypothetical protein
MWLFGAVLLALWRQGSPSAWALLLLAAGGYAPQLSSQVFFGLIGLSLVSSHFLPRDLPVSPIREEILPPAGDFGKFRNASGNDIETVVCRLYPVQ